MKTRKRLFRTCVLCITMLVSIAMLSTVINEIFANVLSSSGNPPYQGIKIVVYFLGAVALPIIIVTVLPGEDELTYGYPRLHYRRSLLIPIEVASISAVRDTYLDFTGLGCANFGFTALGCFTLICGRIDCTGIACTGLACPGLVRIRCKLNSGGIWKTSRPAVYPFVQL